MADISAEKVKELRERTGAGFMDCKNALVEADGDLDAAVAILRDRGLAAAAKKAGREAREGLVSSEATLVRAWLSKWATPWAAGRQVWVPPFPERQQ